MEATAATPLLPVGRYDAAIFDLDGVVTRTARVHAAAWKQVFDEYLTRRASREGGPLAPFDAEEDYRRYVDGKPREDGVRSFLASRGIELPHGKPDDPEDRETVCGLGNRKNGCFRQALRERGVEPFESTIRFIHALRGSGLKTAVVSSSQNCVDVLEAAGIRNLFDAKVDGMDLLEKGLRGKPSPDMFLHAAALLRVSPDRAMVFEDAIAGVQAGRAGRFGLVIGVDRSGQADRLRAEGAGLVIEDLGALRVESELRRLRSLPSALAGLEDILYQAAHRRLVVFLDYDGTLTPIASRPADAVLADSMRQTLERLARDVPVGIISGRDRPEVERLVGLRHLYYAGSHGFDIAGPEGGRIRHELATDHLPDLDRAEQALKTLLGDVPGAWVERKKFSVAVHYRQVAEQDEQAVSRAVDRVAAGAPALRKQGGKKIYELQPAIDWGKGKAVLWLLDAIDTAQAEPYPIYIGDDVTDEDAFRALAGVGVGIVVGDDDRTTAASYALSTPKEVEHFLNRLSGMRRETTR